MSESLIPIITTTPVMCPKCQCEKVSLFHTTLGNVIANCAKCGEFIYRAVAA